MPRLIPVNDPDAVLPVYRGTAVEQLLQYHNLGRPLPATTGHAPLRRLYPAILVAPLLYEVETDWLAQIDERDDAR